MWWRHKNIFTNHQLLNEIISDIDVCRTATDTPGLLMINNFFLINLCLEELSKVIVKTWNYILDKSFLIHLNLAFLFTNNSKSSRSHELYISGSTFNMQQRSPQIRGEAHLFVPDQIFVWVLFSFALSIFRFDFKPLKSGAGYVSNPFEYPTRGIEGP